MMWFMSGFTPPSSLSHAAVTTWSWSTSSSDLPASVSDTLNASSSSANSPPTLTGTLAVVRAVGGVAGWDRVDRVTKGSGQVWAR